MTWRTHELFGIASLWLLAPIPGVITSNTIAPLCALAAFGALLPDLDASVSKIRSLEVGGIRPFVPVSILIHETWGHRGLAHSPLGLSLAGCGALVLALCGYTLPALALWIGYASHLVADACTKSGIPGWPNRVHQRIYLLPPALRFTTGSVAEEALLPLIGMVVLVLLLTHFPHA